MHGNNKYNRSKVMHDVVQHMVFCDIVFTFVIIIGNNNNVKLYVLELEWRVIGMRSLGERTGGVLIPRA